MQSSARSKRKRPFKKPIKMIAKAEYINLPLHLPNHPCEANVRYYQDGLVMDDWVPGGVRSEKCWAPEVLEDARNNDTNANFRDEVGFVLERQREKALNTSVDEMPHFTRVAALFKKLKIKTFRDVVRFTERDFLRNPNFGRKSLRELKEYMRFLGLSLKP